MIPGKVIWTALAITVVALVAVFSYSTINGLSFSETMALTQVLFTILAFSAVLYTLHYASVQFRKSMAKPLIKVAFNDKGEQQATLIYKDGKLKSGLPHPWLIDKGNAVARYFQIDFVFPESIIAQSAIPVLPLFKDNGNYILSYTNEGRYTLFVNTPRSDPNMLFWAAIDTKKCIKVDSFEIEYRVYGDWAETQKGKLKFNINKK
jgi:hypothetical protein